MLQSSPLVIIYKKQVPKQNNRTAHRVWTHIIIRVTILFLRFTILYTKKEKTPIPVFHRTAGNVLKKLATLDPCLYYRM